MGINDVSTVDFIDKPDQLSFLNAFQILIKLGAIDSGDAKITKLGNEMAILPTEPIYSKLLLVAVKHEYLSVTNHISAIVAMLSVENIFFNPSGLDNDDKILKKRIKISSPYSDLLTLYNILHGYR